MINFLLQSGLYIPLWVAIVTGILTTVGGIVLWFLNGKRFFTEVTGLEIKNQGEKLHNLDFENEVFADTYSVIAKLRKENLDLNKTLHQKEINIQIKDMEYAKAQGAIELALRERDDVLRKVRELEDKMVYDHNQCRQEILEIGTKYGRELAELKTDLNNRVHQVFRVVQLLTDNKIDIPLELQMELQNELPSNT